MNNPDKWRALYAHCERKTRFTVMQRIASRVVARFVWEWHTYGYVACDAAKALKISQRFGLWEFSMGAKMMFPARVF